MEILVLLALIILNGLFAMSEMAVVASKKAVIQERANEGNQSAARALELAEDPDRFLSTVQIGITLVGIIAGAFGGSAIADDIANFIRAEVGFLAGQADQIGFALIVLFTTYLALVIGELVPKRIALNYSEQVAIWVAPTMLMLSRIAAPLVWFLSTSTEVITRILRIRDTNAPMTDSEVIAMVQEGVSIGAFDPSEHLMVQGVLELDDIAIREVMTPRMDIVWLNLQESVEESLAKIAAKPLDFYPLCDGDIDNIVGVINAEDILRSLLEKQAIDLLAMAHVPVFIPETAIVASVLRLLQQGETKVLLVVDEYGGFEGLVSENDIVSEILGYFSADHSEPVKRDDGSWLFDGSFDVNDVYHYIPNFRVAPAGTKSYSTLAGLILKQMNRLPQTGDKIQWQHFRIEVIDMDGRRIDKVLISPISEIPAQTYQQDHPAS